MDAAATMRLSPNNALLALMVVHAAACGGGSGGPEDASADASSDIDATTPSDGAADGASTVPTPDGGDGAAGPADAALGDGGLDAGVDPTAPTDCARQTVTIGRNPTSACSFDLPVSIDTSLINVRIARRVGAEGSVVCRVGGSGSCSPSGGWFMFDSETVALCDASCLAFERAGSEAVVVAELGCGPTFCRDSCGRYDEACGPGNNCCPGYECDPATDRCVPCHPVGAECSPEEGGSLCCSNFCSESAECCYDSGDPCRNDGDCCEGTCETGFCS